MPDKLREAVEARKAAAAAGDSLAFTSAHAREQELRERLALQERIHPTGYSFDPRLHPRDRLGQFVNVLAALRKKPRGSDVKLPGGITVERKPGRYEVSVGGTRVGRHRTPETAAGRALDVFDRTQAQHPVILLDREVEYPADLTPTNIPGVHQTARVSTARPDLVQIGAGKDEPFKPGDILTLPFFTGDEPSEYDLEYEVERIDPKRPEREVVLIMLRDGKREKTTKGHFRRQYRSRKDVEADLAARRGAGAGKIIVDQAQRDLDAARAKYRAAYNRGYKLSEKGQDVQAQRILDKANAEYNAAKEAFAKARGMGAGKDEIEWLRSRGTPGVGERAWILPETEAGMRRRGRVAAVQDGQYEIEPVGGGSFMVPEARVVRPLSKDEGGMGAGKITDIQRRDYLALAASERAMYLKIRQMPGMDHESAARYARGRDVPLTTGDEVSHRTDPYRRRGHIVGTDPDDPDTVTVQWYPQDTDMEWVKRADLARGARPGPAPEPAPIVGTVGDLLRHKRSRRR